jgi:hypothetical protein
MSGLALDARSDAATRSELLSLADALRDSIVQLRRRDELGQHPVGDLQQSGDLLQQCQALCTQGAEVRQEPIRTVHQFACSGGTVISKCIAAMPNVQLLSEVDPLAPVARTQNGLPPFTPTDMPALLRGSTRGASDALIAKVFQADLHVLHEYSVRHGLRLVVRDHAHTHYCRGERVPTRPGLRRLVHDVAPVLSLLVVRDPVDSFASLVRNGWVQFTPPDFETYCQRYLRFLDDHADVPLMRYEDFVAEPVKAMKRTCALLELPFVADFPALFSAIRISGDSGRSGSELAARPRRPEAEALRRESKQISSCRLLASRLGYEASDVSADTGY